MERTVRGMVKTKAVSRARAATMHGLLALAFFMLAGAVGGGFAHAASFVPISR